MGEPLDWSTWVPDEWAPENAEATLQERLAPFPDLTGTVECGEEVCLARIVLEEELSLKARSARLQEAGFDPNGVGTWLGVDTLVMPLTAEPEPGDWEAFRQIHGLADAASVEHDVEVHEMRR